MKRELFVFAGQSNMMGASALHPQGKISADKSSEYIHRKKRMGAEHGEFKAVDYNVGEFSYCDLNVAYDGHPDSTKRSTLDHFFDTTYFCPTICNVKNEKDTSVYDFSVFSESKYEPAASLPPIFAEEWEKLGSISTFTQIAKAAVSIKHYFDDEMIDECNNCIRKYNEEHSTSVPEQKIGDMERGASKYFTQKSLDFFSDAMMKYPNDDLSEKSILWMQGESDAGLSETEYYILLTVFWKKLQSLGFKHFFCLRVGFWNNSHISEVISAQEKFFNGKNECYMVTRAFSLMPFFGQDIKAWFTNTPSKEYEFCRDSFYGYNNQHFNEKGFRIAAKPAAENIRRILNGGEPLLEDENLICMNGNK